MCMQFINIILYKVMTKSLISNNIFYNCIFYVNSTSLIEISHLYLPYTFCYRIFRKVK